MFWIFKKWVNVALPSFPRAGASNSIHAVGRTAFRVLAGGWEWHHEADDGQKQALFLTLAAQS